MGGGIVTRQRFLLLLYPAWWRRRYGNEVLTILAETPPSARGVLDLLHGAVDAWIHQRPPQVSFARFGDEARHIVVLAQQEARALHHNYVGTEHLLLGLLAAHDGVAARALTSLGVAPERVRTRIIEIIGVGFESPPMRCARTPAAFGSMPLTPRVKKGFELSCQAADRLGDGDIEAAHLLLGLLDEGEGIGAMILAELVDPERVREQLAHLRAG